MVFYDMNRAVEDCPLNDGELKIIDVVTPGNAINIGEISTFRVKVGNRGPLTAQASKNLVKATLEAWNPTLDHLSNNHSRPLDMPKGIFAAPVVVA